MSKQRIHLVEVGPRDGLQNEKVQLDTSTKIDFINRLSQTGLPTIEATSFVSPKWVPQMADHAAVFQGIEKKAGVHYPVLIPNVTGLNSALEAGVTDIAVFIAASETFSQKNTNCSIADSLDRAKDIIEKARAHSLRIRGYLSCIAGCPYEGNIAEKSVATLATTLLELGCDEISLGDTIGVATPKKVHSLITTLKQNTPIEKIALHAHNTYGMAIANIFQALDMGVTTFDSSVAGLGGCPYAPGASGNVATEEVIYLMQGQGCETGVDLNALIEVGRDICQKLGRAYHQ